MKRIICFMMLLVSHMHAATWFVRAGATGSNNGTSWTNAWTNVTGIAWGSIAAGDTINIAGGTYGDLTLGASGASGSQILIRRATTATNSGDVGWNNAFDAQVILNSIGFSGSFNWITVDGQVTAGIHIAVPQGGGTGQIDFNTRTSSNITFNHLDVSGPCDIANGGSCIHSGDDTAFYVCCAASSNITVKNTKIHGVCTAFQSETTNLVIDHVEIYYIDNGDPNSNVCHPDVVDSVGGTNYTFSNGIIHDYSDEAFLLSSTSAQSWTVYGVVWYNFRSTARMFEAQQGPMTVKFYNNTVDTATNGFVVSGGSFAAGTQLRNNIWYGTASQGTGDEDYELCSSATCTGANSIVTTPPFNNAANHDYTLSRHTTAGFNLGSPYNVDPNGTTRANWDRGAFEALHSAWFVRSGATGANNGTSWANAWTNVTGVVWTSVAAGDTVCIAGGTYGQLSPAKNGTSGNVVTVKRATAADLTCNTTGWQAGFDSQVVVSGIGFSNGAAFITIDGMVWDGIKMTLVGDTGEVGVDLTTITSNDITLRYLQISGPSIAQNSDDDGVRAGWPGSQPTRSNFTFQYLDIDGSATNLFVNDVNNITIEHCRLANSNSFGGTAHPNVWYAESNTNVTFRYNEIINWTAEGILLCGNGSCVTNNLFIYGNLWHTNTGPGGNNPRFIESQSGAHGPIFVYNNTFVGVALCVTCNDPGTSGSFTTDSQFYNNIMWNGNGLAFTTNVDYDLSDGALSEPHGQGNAASPFVNLSADTVAGYHLKAHTNAGNNLGSPYNIDYDGNTRSNWDRGFVEYISSTPVPTTYIFGNTKILGGAWVR